MPASARVLRVDAGDGRERLELWVTDGGAMQRFELGILSLALLVETGTAELAHALRRGPAEGHETLAGVRGQSKPRPSGGPETGV